MKRILGTSAILCAFVSVSLAAPELSLYNKCKAKIKASIACGSGDGAVCDRNVQRACGLANQASPADVSSFTTTIGRKPSSNDEDRVLSQEYPLPRRSGHVNIYAVFDGHGGPYISKELDKKFARYLMKELSAYPGDALTGEQVENTKAIIHQVFMKLDKDICANKILAGSYAGSTATVVILLKDFLFVANAGDSRTAILLDGKLDETTDHKPSDDPERQRIKNAGGYVKVDFVGTARAMNELAVSRGFGDCRFKHVGRQGYPESQPYKADGWISVIPEILTFRIGTSENRKKGVIVLGSDGVWDALSSDDAVKLKDGDEIVETAYNRGSRDEISAIMIKLQ